MKIKEGFILREVAGSYLVVAVGKAVKEFGGVVNLNETGAFLWKLLEKSSTESEMVDALLSEYEVDRDTAEKDVKAFTDKLMEAKLVE
ncbi:MAG: PqqD family protein [Candidatus Borkfalkiaceae bacterium]|nr:PqqD family protein [Christensenellaceae bacterium]